MNLAVVNPRAAARLRVPSSVNDLFDQLFAEAVRPVQPAAGFLPTADVVETTDAYELHLTLPGFRKEDIKLDVDQGKLTVSGERKRPEEEGRTYRVAESRFGAFERTFALPDTVDVTAIKASLDLGILTVRLPKDQQKTAKLQIEIQ